MTTRWNCAILNIRRALPVDGVPRGVYKEVTVSLGGLAVTSLLLSVILFEQGNNRNYAHIMGTGYLGIFVVTGVIIGVVTMLKILTGK